MKIVCAWCEKEIGNVAGSGISHGICDKCLESEMGKLPNKKSNPREEAAEDND